MVRPATGAAANVWQYQDVKDKYSELSDGRALWTEQGERSQKFCVHGENCRRSHCEVGKASQTIHLVSGQFVVLWGFLKECVPKGKTLRLVQVALTEPFDASQTDEDAATKGETEKRSTPIETKSDETPKQNGETGETASKSVETGETMETEEVSSKRDANGETGENGENGETSLKSSEAVETEEPSATPKQSVETVETVETSKPPEGDRRSDLLLTGVRIPGEKIAMLRAKLQEMKAALVNEGTSEQMCSG